MSDKNPDPGDGTNDPLDADKPASPQRRQLLGGMVSTSAMLAMGGALAQAGSAAPSPSASPSAPPDSALEGQLDDQLRRHVRNVVVVYAENRSFNNLFADFPGLQHPLRGLRPEQYRQLDRDGSPLQTLPPVWGGLIRQEQKVGQKTYRIEEKDIVGLPNAPWALRTATGEGLPHELITPDLWHLFYENQMQINGGKNDMFVAWGNTGAQVMGHYANGATKLRLWRIARRYTLCDNFFMGAFGGSFLNHQYLVAAQPPFYPNADQSPVKSSLSVCESDQPTRLKLSPTSPASAMDGQPEYISSGRLTPDFWVVNTMGPPYAPAFDVDPANPTMAKPGSPAVVPQVHQHIGDMLGDKGVDWAWYAGAWQAALNGRGASPHGELPGPPNFQVHHQPLNYFSNMAPGTAARERHLRDGGVGETVHTNHFLADAAAGRLPAVSYYKPQGNFNMHSGYASVEAGDRHLATVVDTLRRSPQWKHMVVVITFDENGGWWDHVAPPKGDRWGPGTRIPAIVISPFARRGHVDHTIYDTGSIARFITRRFGLEKLPGLKMREDAMIAAGGPAAGDLTAALVFPKSTRRA